MSYRALYRAWRPETFRDIVGQDAIVQTLIHQVESGRIAHAYLFCGSRGTGKTTTAKVLARAINCTQLQPGAQPCGICPSCVQLKNENNLDIAEIDAASNNGVDDIRDLREKVQYPPQVGRYKVCIIDEVHMLSTGAFNALLKTLEEPPAHVVFILATTEPQKLPATILSRCQRFDFHRIRLSVIVDRLKTVLDGSSAKYEDSALQEIARAAEGGMRDALSIADMCLSYGSGRITSELVHGVLGTAGKDFMFDFSEKLIRYDAAGAIDSIDRLVRNGQDPQVFARDTVGHLRSLLMAQIAGESLADLLEITQEDAQRYREQAKTASKEFLMRAMERFVQAESDMKWAQQPRTVVELCTVRVCTPEQEPDDTAFMERLAKVEKSLQDGVAIKSAPGNAAEKAGVKHKNPPSAKPHPTQPPAEGADVWQEVLDRLKTKSPSTFPLVRNAIFRGVNNRTVILEYPRAYGTFYNSMLKDQLRRQVEETASEVYGEEMTVQATMEQPKKQQQSGPDKSGLSNLNQIYTAFGRENVDLVDSMDS